MFMAFGPAMSAGAGLGDAFSCLKTHHEGVLLHGPWDGNGMGIPRELKAWPALYGNMRRMSWLALIEYEIPLTVPSSGRAAANECSPADISKLKAFRRMSFGSTSMLPLVKSPTHNRYQSRIRARESHTLDHPA